MGLCVPNWSASFKRSHYWSFPGCECNCAFKRSSMEEKTEPWQESRASSARVQCSRRTQKEEFKSNRLKSLYNYIRLDDQTFAVKIKTILCKWDRMLVYLICRYHQNSTFNIRECNLQQGSTLTAHKLFTNNEVFQENSLRYICTKGMVLEL